MKIKLNIIAEQKAMSSVIKHIGVIRIEHMLMSEKAGQKRIRQDKVQWKANDLGLRRMIEKTDLSASQIASSPTAHAHSSSLLALCNYIPRTSYVPCIIILFLS